MADGFEGIPPLRVFRDFLRIPLRDSCNYEGNKNPLWETNMIRIPRWIVLGMTICLASVGSFRAVSAAELRVATFQCDATPPIGHWLYAEDR